MRAGFENGKLVTQWFGGVTPVFGGWVVRRLRWHRTAGGWDLDEEWLNEPERVFATREAAQEAYGEMLRLGGVFALPAAPPSTSTG